MKLEELARHSSDAARVSVAHVDLPPLGDERPGHSWVTPVFAAAGVAALVVAGLVVADLLNTGDHAVSNEVVPPVVEVPHLVLPADSGWTATIGSTEEVLSGGETERATFTYFGRAGTDDPFVDGDLLVATFPASSDAEAALSDEGDTVSVRETDGVLASGGDTGLPPRTRSLQWTERGADGAALEVVLVSQGFDGERLIEIADAMTVDVATEEVTPAADLGLERVARASGTPFDALRHSTEGSFIAYEDPSGSGTLVISAGRASLEREAVVMRWWMGDVTPTTVDDRPGYLSARSELLGGGQSLMWSPADGIVANVMYVGSDETVDVVSLAESLVALDDATWEALIESIGMPGAAGADDFDEVYGESTGTVDGVDYAWALGIQNGGDLCFQIRLGGDGLGSSCQPRLTAGAPAGSARTVDSGGDDVITYVVIAADPAIERVIDPSGRFTVDRVDADGIAWFVAIGMGGDVTFDVVDAGTVVGSVGSVGIGVEGVAEAEVPLTDSAAAVELGLADMTAIAQDGPGDLPWMLGRQAADLCLISGGDAPSAECYPDADLVVFSPNDIDGEPRTMVVMRDLPACIEGVSLLGPTVDRTVSGGDEFHDYDIWVAFGANDGWVARLDTGVGGDVDIDLAPEGGVVDWPTPTCEG